MKKHLKWILPVAAAVLVLAVLGIVLAVVGFGNDAPTEPVDTEMKIYWNVDQALYADGTKVRSPRNGKYFATFAVDGEQVDLYFDNSVLMEHADTLEFMGLTFNEEGVIVDIVEIKEFTGGLAVRNFYITEVTKDTIVCNSLQNLSGFTMTLKYDENTQIYDVSGEGPLVGIPGILAVGNGITGVQDENGVLTHIWMPAAFETSPVYWNITRMYDSDIKRTTRERNANGEYEYEFAVEGEIVKLRTRDPEVADAIDGQSNKCLHLEFDEEGYISAASHVRNATGGSTTASGYYVTEINETNMTCEGFSASNKGKITTPRLAPGYKVYDVSGASDYIGQPTQVQLYDQVRCIKDSTGDVCIVFILNRNLDGDIYWNLERKYDSENKVTTRTVDAEGYYVFTMAYQGKHVTLRTKDRAIATTIDARSVKAVGLTVEGDIITGAYVPSKMKGGVSFASYYVVTGIAEDGTVTAYKESTDTTAAAKLTADSKVYNVSSEAGFVGELTSLRVGDQIHGLTDLFGNINILYVVKRTSDSPMYWNVDKAQYWDSKNEVTKRTPAADGYYYFVMAENGKQVTLKTADKAIADNVDSRGIMGLKLSGDVIVKVFGATSTVNTKGGLFASGYYVTAIDGNKITAQKLTGTDKGDVVTASMAWNCSIYNVSPTAQMVGEKSAVQVGDQIRGLLNSSGQIDTLYVLTQNKHSENHVCDCCNEQVVWMTWNGTSTMVDGGHYCIAGDVELTKYFPIAKNATVTICLNGMTVTAPNNRVFPTIKEGVTVNIVDHTGNGVLHGMQNRNGAVAVVDGGTLNIYGGTLTANEITAEEMNGGLLVLINGGQVNMYGGTITGGKTTGTSGNININSGTVTLNGGKITGGTAGLYGGNIALTGSSAKLIVNGGEISGGTSGSYGGNIAIASSKAVVQINGGKIADGTATTHGGNIGLALGTVTMTGGEVSGGKAATYGSCVSVVNTGAFTVTGGEISGGQFHARADSVITLGGTAKISELYLVKGKTVAISGTTALTSGAKISISMEQPGVFAKAVKTDLSGCFTSLDPAYEAAFDSGALTLMLDSVVKHIHCWCGGTKPAGHTCEETVKWQPMVNGMSFENGGHYYLTQEYTNRISIPDGIEVFLCLNGITYTRQTSRVFSTIGPDTTVNICDCSSEHTGTLHGKKVDDGAPVAAVGGGTLNIYGGTLTADALTVEKKNGGVLNVYGGGQINMYGGTITGGKATGAGGNVNVVDGIFNLYGGNITNGTSGLNADDKYGGNIAVTNASGKLLIAGGTVSGGTSGSYGGNIAVGKAAQLEITGGQIKNGTAATHGGNITMALGTLTMTDGMITGGTAGTYGSSISMAGTAAAQITGGSVTGGELRTRGDSQLTLGGTVEISELYLTDGKTVELSDEKPLDDANIGIAMETLGIFAENVETDVSAMFSSYDDDYDVLYDADAMTISLYELHKHCWCENADTVPADHEHVDLTWNAIAKGGAATLEDGEAYYLDWSGKSAQSITVADGATAYLCLNGASIRAGNTITLGTDSKLYICDCSEEQTGIIATTNYTPVQIASGNEVYLMSGTITGIYGTQASRISVMVTGGSFYMYGGAVADGCSNADNVTNGRVDENVDGANIRIESGTAAIYGGTVSGGVTEGKGKDVYVGGTGTITIGGKAKIGDLYLPNGKTVTVETLDATASVGISMETVGDPIATGLTADHSANFTSNVDGVIPVQTGDTLVLALKPHQHCWCIKADAKPEGHTCVSTQVWTSISSSVTIENNGYYYVDFAKAGQAMSVTVAEGVEAYLCLNGKQIYAGNTIKLEANAKLTVCDCSEEQTGMIRTSTAASAGAPVLLDGSNKTFTLVSGTINANAGRTSGYLHSVEVKGASSTFYMYGGKIEGNSDKSVTSNGGNLYVTKGTVHMYGGTITGGQSTLKGGNVCIAGTGTFNLYGGEISNGQAGTSGGNVSVNSGGTFHMEGGKIIGGKAANGAAMHTYNSTIEILGGTVSNGTATESANCIYSEGGSVIVGDNVQVEIVNKK